MSRAMESPAPRTHAPDDQATRLRLLVSSLRARDRAPSLEPPATPPVVTRPQARVITVASGKGGVGKSCVSVCLASAMAAHGQRVTLLDADFGTANADVLCGVLPRVRLDVLMHGRNDADLTQIAIETPWSFHLVPGAVGSASASAQDAPPRTRVLDAVRSLDPLSDRIIVDTCAGIGPEVLQMVQFADVAAIVVTPDPSSIADAYALLKVLAMAPVPEWAPPSRTLGLVLNQVTDETEALRVHGRIATTADRFLGWRVPMLGWIPSDEALRRAVRARRAPEVSLDAEASSGKAFRRLASDLLHPR